MSIKVETKIIVTCDKPGCNESAAFAGDDPEKLIGVAWDAGWVSHKCDWEWVCPKCSQKYEREE